MFTTRVVDALQAFARRAVAVAYCVRVDVGVAVAWLTRSALAAKTPFWVAEESVAAQLAARAGVTNGAFQTDNSFIGQFDASSA